MSGRIQVLATATARTLAISFPTVFDQLRGRTSMDACDLRLRRWSRALLDDVGIRITVRGAEHLAPRAPMIVMSNHQSLYDIPVIFQVIEQRLRMVSKIELASVPVWGAAMRASGFIFVDRRNREAAIRSLSEARSMLDEGVLVWIAPEGTRSRDGTLLPFKKGGFVLAEEMNVPVLPISIHGTSTILPARTWDLRRDQGVRVTVHPRITRESFPTREAFMAAVRDAIASGLGDDHAAGDSDRSRPR
jgi:1-acyl-sn-glycerol-3-phosphate acyltransferase